MTEVNDRTVVYDISNGNHGEVCENTAVWNAGRRSISAHGGMYNLLPFFYLIRFYPFESYPSLLEELLELVRVVFASDYTDVQEESLNCMFFEVVGAQLSETDTRWLTVNAVRELTALNLLVTNLKLREQFFRGLLWKLNLKQVQQLPVVSELMRLLRECYAKEPRMCLQQWDLEHCLHYIEQNFEPARA